MSDYTVIMTYSESAKGITITRDRALAELRKHSITDASEFFAEMGDKPVYSASSVLDWLGY